MNEFFIHCGRRVGKNTPVKNFFDLSFSHNHSLDTVYPECRPQFWDAGRGDIPGKQLFYTGIYGYGMVPISCHHGRCNRILKMLALPVSTAKLCMAKFVVLVSFSAIQFLMSVGMYYISIAIASHTQGYDFFLSPLFVCKEVGMMWLSSIPMLTFFWLLAVCIQTPVFSIGIGLASVVPSVLMINTKVWFAYPMAYPFFVITSEYGKLAANISTEQVRLIPWLPTAALITAVCLTISCIRFGQAERR